MTIHSQILVKIRQAVWPSIRITQTDRHTSLPLYIRRLNVAFWPKLTMLKSLATWAFGPDPTVEAHCAPHTSML